MALPVLRHQSHAGLMGTPALSPCRAPEACLGSNSSGGATTDHIGRTTHVLDLSVENVQ